MQRRPRRLPIHFHLLRFQFRSRVLLFQDLEQVKPTR